MGDKMKKVYYHVVTNKPVYKGQIIKFDENYHSGVYERVYNLQEIVNDIYSNPTKYDDSKLDHHTKVALRELAMEEVRKKKYPNLPSRLKSLYVSDSLEKANKWYELFIEWNRPTFQIVKVVTDGNSFKGDACNCFEGTTDKKKNLELSERYWTGLNNIYGDTPIYEILLDGNIEVLEIIKENLND